MTQLTEYKEPRRFLIVPRTHVLGQICRAFLQLPREEIRQIPGVLQRKFPAIHTVPVDITVDKEPPPNDEKPQQNQRFKYRGRAPELYRAGNRELITMCSAIAAVSSRSNPPVTGLLNLHRVGATCSLSVTSVGICLSRQQRAFPPPVRYSPPSLPAPLTRFHRGTIVATTFGFTPAREPGVFRGIHESA